MVVGNDDPDLGGHVALRRARGSFAMTVVPPASLVSTLSVPPSSSARSRIEVRPTPAGTPSATPCPSSATLTSRASPAIPRRTRTVDPPLCRAAFVRPSRAIRRRRPRRRPAAEGGRPAHRASRASPARSGHPRRTPRCAGGARRRGRPRRGRAVAGYGDPPYLVDHPPRVGRQVVKELGGSGWIGSQQRACRGDLHHRARQGRPELVVEVSTKSASLLLASRDERLARAPEVGRQANRLDGRRRLPGQVGEQPLVGGAERLARAARAECQVPHGPAAIDDRQADQRAGAGRVDRPPACRASTFCSPARVPSSPSSSIATYGERIASATPRRVSAAPSADRARPPAADRAAGARGPGRPDRRT